MQLIVLLPSAVAAVATTLWSLLYVSIPLGVIIGIAWILSAFIVGKYIPGKTPLQVSIFAGVLVVSSVINLTYNQIIPDKPKDQSESTETDEQVIEDTKDPEGTIVVEAGDGILTTNQYDTLSYIAESARGREAYLAGKLATASYNVNIETAGSYDLWIKLSDDALHSDESRSATIIVNGSQQLKYKHISEDTKGWKYYNIGQVQLNSGTNKFEFSKMADTSAAFVMDEFKLIPYSE
ncbi:MAG: hypothetical protein BWY19_00978 [bacterium ADurb.Bin212]|nr:MAG: hypothetical protein BWY19_00978 [bacterium ADurb.Bin212]